MSKSVYSVILNDELVAELDRVAYKNGVSRSAMIDKILSGYLTVETPAVKMESIFSQMERLIGEWSGLRFINQPHLAMASVQSALTYRYNPTVKYSVELYPGSDDLGEVKISLRTQNSALIALMEDFYKFFIYLERKYLGEREYTYENYRFTRVMKTPSVSAAETGEGIAYFVRSFNYLLNGYFSGLDNLSVTKELLENKYREEIAKNIIV
ncbi:MAG: hypothetical protein J5836_03450 [Clostridia bacterium]|nr:hypothetical protein [Clostridia bacterium]